MKKYLLDTSICVEFLRGNPIITALLAALLPQDVVVCSVVKAELYFGAYRSQHPTKALSTLTALLDHFQSLPFDDKVVETYGQLRADLTSKGTLIGPNDLLIAAIALVHNVTLVTHNMSEFSRVPQLSVEDWMVS